MFAVQVRTDDEMELLLFASREGALSFIKLCLTYQTDSGAGNGYGAYWIFDDTIETTDGASDRYKRLLDHDRVLGMIADIADARSSKEQEPILPAYTVGQENNAIVFTMGEFAPRTLPIAGDMYRLFDWDAVANQKEPLPSEGRVVQVVDGMATVYWALDEGQDGKPKPDIKTYTLPLAALMRIPDWLEEHRESRKNR